MNRAESSRNFRRVLAQVGPSEFIGRAEQLERIVARRNPEHAGRGLLLLMEPAAGVSELLRQAYDEIFNDQKDVIPIYFAFTRHETTAVSAAIEFFNTFLQQYIAFRENDPSIAQSTLTFPDLLEHAKGRDRQWIKELNDLQRTLSKGDDDKALVRFCLSAPQRIPPDRGRPLIMLDGAQLAQYLNGVVPLGTEVLRVFGRSGAFTFVLAGLRRQLLEAAQDAGYENHLFEPMHVRRLGTDEASKLVEQVASRKQVEISEHTRDLLVQQFGGSPFFINLFLETAREKGRKLILPRDCQNLYVDELFGGNLHNYFETLLEEISPRLNTRLLLIACLWDTVSGRDPASSFATWEQRLDVDEKDLTEMLNRLHMHELVNWELTNIHAATGPPVWVDYLKIRYQLDAESRPRAVVYGDALTDALKRAPYTRNRQLKQRQLVNPGELVSRFHCQRVPAVLFDYAKFSLKYKGEETDVVEAGLDKETEFLKLPETVHVTSCAAFNNDKRQISEDERCVIARTFEDGEYSDDNDVVWLVAVIETKQAVNVDEGEARMWCERLKELASDFGFKRYQIWLISNAGFTDDALRVLEREEYKAYSSNSRQFERLSVRLGQITPVNPDVAHSEASEFRMEIPFGEDNELIAASAAEAVAKRLPFPTEAINNIKHAIIEACLNVFEHSFSPDQKISQRFRLESDRLVVTISSRGVVPTNLNGASSRSDTTEAAEERRGRGLILIRSLMDEVEFEPVDDGTSLRMTKYLRETAS